MSLIMSGWSGGYETFLDFADTFWDPVIFATKKSASSDSHLCVRLFDESAIADFISVVPKEFVSEFIVRYNKSFVTLMEKCSVPELIKKFGDNLIKEGKDLQQVLNQLTLNLRLHFADIEFKYRLNLIDCLANHIFYGTFDDPGQVVFFIPPISEWGDDNHDGWEGFWPFYGEDGDGD